MRFKIVFKTPDTMQDSINSEIDRLGITDEEQKHRITMQLMELAEDYIAYGEQVVLEFDTDTSAVRVKQCRQCLKQSNFAIQTWLKDNPGWDYTNNSLVKEFKFEDFNSAMAFANRVGMYAERNDHHPVMEITWGRVKVTWTTYDAGGVTVRDLAGASHSDSYFPRNYGKFSY
jgi:4a-hydroxytetrahydrobiopterin dehydratase